jgi:hypothetical protein
MPRHPRWFAFPGKSIPAFAGMTRKGAFQRCRKSLKKTPLNERRFRI